MRWVRSTTKFHAASRGGRAGGNVKTLGRVRRRTYWDHLGTVKQASNGTWIRRSSGLEKGGGRKKGKWKKKRGRRGRRKGKSREIINGAGLLDEAYNCSNR